MKLPSLPVLIPHTTHPAAAGGVHLNVEALDGTKIGVLLGGTEWSDLWTTYDPPGEGNSIERRQNIISSRGVRDAARVFDGALSRLLDARCGATDARAGAAKIGSLMAYSKAPYDSRGATHHILYAGEAESEAVRDAAALLNLAVRQSKW